LGDFRRAMREFFAFSDAGAQAQEITSQQHQALLAIRSHDGEDPISIGELAASLMIKNHSAVGLIARLVERGLVSRRPSPDDRRRVLLTLEPEGVRILDAICERNLTQLQQTRSILVGLVETLDRLGRP